MAVWVPRSERRDKGHSPEIIIEIYPKSLAFDVDIITAMMTLAASRDIALWQKELMVTFKYSL